MSIVVAVTGKPRCGKNTLANWLQAKKKFDQFAIAHPLYEEVATAFDTTVEALQTHEAKTIPSDLLAGWRANDPDYRLMLKGMGEDLFTPRTSRYHLRFWGTEYRRKRQPRYWADRLLSRLDVIQGAVSIVIDDMRAYDRAYTEYAVLREFASRTGRRFMLVEVQRDGEEPWGHSSDDRFPDHMIDLTLRNVEGRPDVMLKLAYQHILEMTGNTK